MLKKITAILLGACMLLPLVGCGKTNPDLPEDLGGALPQKAALTEPPADAEKTYADFAAELLVKCYDGGNALLSPLSVLGALGMTAGGAKGETLAQMERVLGMRTEEIAAYLATFGNDGSDKAKLSIANSLWVREDLKVREEFLQKNADGYGASIFKTAFGDETAAQINKWVEEHTDGLVKDILDRVPAVAVMYLVNALAFDAEWETVYRENEVRTRDFTDADGKKSEVKMLYSEESRYLEDESTTGFLKYYAGRRYAFAALLPSENIPIADYVASLDGEKLTSLLENVQSQTVNAGLPRFESEYAITLNDALVKMGMTDAFDEGKADFSGMAELDDGNNLCISRVLHKTFIAVDERGTKAGAATVVEMKECAAFIPEQPKEVILDRPFVYMLVDCENGNAPIFIGVVSSVR